MINTEPAKVIIDKLDRAADVQGYMVLAVVLIAACLIVQAWLNLRGK